MIGKRPYSRNVVFPFASVLVSKKERIQIVIGVVGTNHPPAIIIFTFFMKTKTQIQSVIGTHAERIFIRWSLN